MKKIIWNEKFTTGIIIFDQQHKKIIDLINELIELRNSKLDHDYVNETLIKMTQYAIEHLQTEEKLMLEYDYPEYENHKLEHKEFRKKTISLSMEKTVYDETILNQILEYLTEWWKNHILYTDKKYSTFFLEKEMYGN